MGGLSDEFHERIARTGIIPPRVTVDAGGTLPTLSEFVAKFIAVASTSTKPNTIRLLRQTEGKLLEFFADDPRIDRITRDRAADCRS